MKAFDTDILTEILAGAPEYVARAARVPAAERCITVVTMEEGLRGLLDGVRRAEAGRGRAPLSHAYERVKQTVGGFGKWAVLSYSPEADAWHRAWKTAGVRVRPHDLRIASICVTARVTLITRNRRDFEQVPGLELEVWP